MRLLLTAVTLLLSTIFNVSFAQVKTGKINGTVNDSKIKPLESATASLLKASDSSIVKLTASDKMGKFGFENLANGKYIVSISAIGNTTSFSDALEVTDVNKDITLKPIN